MYVYVDRPVCELATRGRLLVFAMRLWVKAVGERQCPGQALAPAFVGLSALTGLQPFMAMMALFNRHALEQFQFCATGCPRISEHEAVILATLDAVQHARPHQARETLALVVADEAVAPLMDAMVRLTGALDRV